MYIWDRYRKDHLTLSDMGQSVLNKTKGNVVRKEVSAMNGSCS